jgi:lipopolysaccharide transport system ATP-binding protein
MRVNAPTGRAEITVTALRVDFPLYHGNARSLKKMVFSSVSGRMGSDSHNRVVVQALRDVSFSLRSGERLGLVGSNGAGKTTLLRALAGIYEPVGGQLRVTGTINALLDPNLGMNPDLTGRENIALRALYVGMSAGEIPTLEQDVAEFAELGDFLDLPVRIYSAGMVIRLGFGLATAFHPQVLLMDEWILAGDANFMIKAQARLENLVRGAEILVLSSHAPAVVMDWCTRVLWMDQGRIRADGTPAEVLPLYLGPPVKHAEPVKQAATGSL